MALAGDLQPPALTTNVSHRAVGSRLVHSGYWELEQSSNFSSIFGTVDLDLRQATLHGSQSQLVTPLETFRRLTKCFASNFG